MYALRSHRQFRHASPNALAEAVIIIVIIDVGEESIEHYDPEISLFILPNKHMVKHITNQFVAISMERIRVISSLRARFLKVQVPG